jgi:hypothetical protein
MPRNTLMDLNNHLFAELERLGDEDLTQEELEKEIARADAITKVGNVLVNNAKTALEATKTQMEWGRRENVQIPEMLLENKNHEK